MVVNCLSLSRRTEVVLREEGEGGGGRDGEEAPLARHRHVDVQVLRPRQRLLLQAQHAALRL